MHIKGPYLHCGGDMGQTLCVGSGILPECLYTLKTIWKDSFVEQLLGWDSWHFKMEVEGMLSKLMMDGMSVHEKRHMGWKSSVKIIHFPFSQNKKEVCKNKERKKVILSFYPVQSNVFRVGCWSPEWSEEKNTQGKMSMKDQQCRDVESQLVASEIGKRQTRWDLDLEFVILRVSQYLTQSIKLLFIFFFFLFVFLFVFWGAWGGWK